MSWVLPQGAPSAWEGVRTAPLLSGELLTLDHTGRAQLETAGFEEGVAALRAAAQNARSRGSEDLAVWFLAEAARKLAQEQRWEEADTLYSEALALEAPRRKPAVAAQLYREWGDLFQRRFAWDRARECYERALTADRRKAFGSLTAAWSLAGLGLIDLRSGGPEEEEDLYRQAIEIRQRLAPGSAEDAMGWLQWGHAAALAADWPAAIERYQRTIGILPERGASRLLLAEALANLAYVQGKQGEAEAARKSWTRAQALVMAEAPEDYLVAGIDQGLGLMAAQQGDLHRAEALLQHSLEVCRRHRPGSLDEADSLRELGRLQMQVRKQGAGSRHLCQAMDVVEAWRGKLQTNQDMRHWWGRFSADYHRDCAESLVAIGQPENAFLAVEKGRARGFLDLRAERGLRLAALAPERNAQWRKLDADYERAQEDLRRASAHKDTALEQIVNFEGRLREIRRQKERLLERDLAPGSIRYPEPLSLAEARRHLEPGTALLFYSVGRTKTLLFVLSPEGASPGWTVVPLEIGGAGLKKKIGFFRKTLVDDRLNRRAASAQARALYDLLVRQAEPYLAGAERIVLSPDGPLHTLPFAALMRGEQYLVEWKPLHFTLSATVYAEQLAHRASAASAKSVKLVAFGDPLYAPLEPDEAAASADTGSRKILGRGVVPLPATRQEVEGIASLFPGALTLLGVQVTEEKVKEAVRGASHVHFAVHGVFSERAPLNSALVLSPPGKPGEGGANGLLQAWEVMESLPLDADLVVLSACDTALGREVGGEGLIGLTRAFQYAGARSVVATLWGISDRSTSDLMTELYRALQAGQSKDEALRTAQLAQIRSSKPQPFYWAAFQLFGDWR